MVVASSLVQILNITYNTPDVQTPTPLIPVETNIVISFTLDAGVHWNSTYYNISNLGLDLPNNFTLNYPVVGTFDKFGNYWLGVAYVDPASRYQPLGLFVSVDGGQNFQYVESIDFFDGVYAAYPYSVIDFDLKSGWSGIANQHVLYITGTLQQQFSPFAREVFLAYKPVAGLGNYSTPAVATILTSVQLAPGSNNSLISAPQLVVGSHGVLSIIARTEAAVPAGINVYSPTCVITAVTPRYIIGTGNYGRTVMYNLQNLSYFPVVDGPLDVYTSNIGYNNGIGQAELLVAVGKGANFLNSLNYQSILAEINTGLYPEGLADIAYDPTCKLLYVAYCDQKPIFFDSGNFPQGGTLTNMTIYVITSRNHGKTWSNQRQVSKYTTNGRGIVTISVDPTLGVVSVCWLDAHIDTNLVGNVQPYCTTFKSELF